jgi:peptidoglycan/LPS O-acetylase OafA/YrhL
MTLTVSLPDSQICVIAAATGALSHWTYFKHGEHHLQAALYFKLAFALPALIAGGLWQYTDLDGFQAIILTSKIVLSYYTALWTSILVYRTFFHRLRNFPGPFMARTSKLWHVWILRDKLDNFRQLDEMHKVYGDFVRTGKMYQV